MSAPLPATAESIATQPTTLRSHLVLVRMGLMLAGILIPAFGLPVLIGACLLLSEGNLAWGGGLLLLGLLMLAAAWPLLRRSMLPVLATLTPAALRLEPRDRSVAYGLAPAEYPLGDFTGFGEILSQGGSHIKLYRANGPMLQLADRPKRGISAAEANLPGLVDALSLSEAMQGQVADAGAPAESLHRPNFYQSGLGRALAWLCYALMALGVVLLLVPGVEWTVSLRLFTFTALYLGLYRRNQKTDDSAAPAEAK
ncbi:hypothetical protein [Hymenobacter properus]|uniref:Uncharacterized protein n=1 Tax=Hymenobacter properus TaxID=2791026 RepID=A0A931FIN7_9BACT|nr:hypothetical protein [Hymenobacter properus]MBF9140998.1 hypothetical protein [Hymenobacter properus]MBR7719807.1 hypothetical protein [Microvirga sp. SRT04]